ncbi:MAG: hypothetical protein NZM37_00990 [Sandaracinaceae bacterium]|nr:hypothetical protein [Sandaracinaceae bacterium]
MASSCESKGVAERRSEDKAWCSQLMIHFWAQALVKGLGQRRSASLDASSQQPSLFIESSVEMVFGKARGLWVHFTNHSSSFWLSAQHEVSQEKGLGRVGEFFSHPTINVPTATSVRNVDLWGLLSLIAHQSKREPAP